MKLSGMVKMMLATLLTVGFSLPGASNALAAQHGAKRPDRKAVLLVAFGTTVPSAQKAFKDIDAQARKMFPGVEVRWAYTSKIIRGILAKRGRHIDSPELALAKLMDQGVTEVAVQSLQTIPGIEFHELYRNAMFFGQMTGGFKRIEVGSPLLASDADMQQVVKVMLQRVPKDRKAGDAVIFMGHGTEHPADTMYAAMNYFFQQQDPNAYVATVEGHLTLDKMLPELRRKKVKKVYLIPLMAVACDHAHNDMAGTEPTSWKSILDKAGYTCIPVMRGMGEDPGIVAVWLDHLRKAYGEL